MSWTDIFPVLDDEMVDTFRLEATEHDLAEFEEWFGHAEILSPRRDNKARSTTRPHIVATSLFWKHVDEKHPELPIPTKERMIDAQRMGLVKRFPPWETYVKPLLTYSSLIGNHPEVIFRIYLAADLSFLGQELCELGWEVYLMKSSSVRFCPGGFWRFLALQETGALLTIIDSDRMGDVSEEIGRTEAMAAMGLGLWRVPGYYNSPLTTEIRYRPILAGHFGAKGGEPVRMLAEAFIWHCRQGTIRQTAFIPGIGERPIRFARWPNYGFDECFLLTALYPRLVKGGTLTFIPSDSRSLLLPADIEYAMWANPISESIYF